MANILSKFIETRKAKKMIRDDFLSFKEKIINKEFDIVNNEKVLDYYIQHDYFSFYDILVLLDVGVYIDTLVSYSRCIDLIAQRYIECLNTGDLSGIIYYNDKYYDIFDYVNIDSIISKLNVNDELLDKSILKDSSFYNYNGIKKLLDIARKSGYVPFKNGLDVSVFFERSYFDRQKLFQELGLMTPDIYNQLYKYKLNKYIEWLYNKNGEEPKIEIIDTDFDNLNESTTYWINQSKLLGHDAIESVMRYIRRNLNIEDLNGLFDENYIPTDKFFKTKKRGFPITRIMTAVENFKYDVDIIYFMANNIDRYDGVYKKFLELFNMHTKDKSLLYKVYFILVLGTDYGGIDENGINEKAYQAALRSIDTLNVIKDIDPNYLNHYSAKQLQYIKFIQKHNDLVEYLKNNTGKDTDEFIELFFNESGASPSMIRFLYDKYEWNYVINVLNYSGGDELFEMLDEKEQTIIMCYKDIIDVEIQNYYKDYMKKYQDNISIDKIHLVADVLDRISKSNSEDLLNIKISLADQVLNTDNPLESLEKIEKIFIKNNLPLFGKIFSCFQILYPEFEKIEYQNNVFNFSDESRMAPQLKNQTLPNVGISKDRKDIRFNIIFNDLLRIALKSNSKDLRDYLNNIEYGNNIFLSIINNNLDISKLNVEQKTTLEIFANHLETLLEKVIKDDDKIDLDNASLADRIKVLGSLFKPTERYDLKDRIVRTFCHYGGINSFDELVSIMDSAVKEADARGRKYEQELFNNRFEFEPGDFLRCIGGYESFGSTLANGNFSKEFLSVFTGKSDSDTTPLDIDFTLIDSKNDNIYESVKDTPTGFGFGNIYVIIKKDNPNLNITRDSCGNLTGHRYDASKIEMFGTKIGKTGYETHWGARTGIAFTDVDYILYKKDKNIDSSNPYDSNGNVNYVDDKDVIDDLSKIKFEIAKNGYYIPIIDFSGKLIFTTKEYECIRKGMDGLSYYGNSSYQFSNNLEIPGLETIVDQIDMSLADSRVKREKINGIIDNIFVKFGLTRKDEMDNDLTPGSVEFIDTGSTGRYTNVPFKADFDFLLRVDQNLVTDKDKYNEFKDYMLDTFEKYPIREIVITDSGDYRLKGVQLDDNTNIDIDLSFVVKTDKVTYSSDQCVKDRLETIKKNNSEKYKYVVANIILAKEILKESNVYKPSRTDKNQGGLGGIGIENWILQNGGSFIDAAKNFLKESEGKSFEEFKQSYSLWDFGKNHFAAKKGKYPYDNFIANNMNESGYIKMRTALVEYLNSLDLNYSEEKKGIINS